MVLVGISNAGSSDGPGKCKGASLTCLCLRWGGWNNYDLAESLSLFLNSAFSLSPLCLLPLFRGLIQTPLHSGWILREKKWKLKDLSRSRPRSHTASLLLFSIGQGRSWASFGSRRRKQTTPLKGEVACLYRDGKDCWWPSLQTIYPSQSRQMDLYAHCKEDKVKGEEVSNLSEDEGVGQKHQEGLQSLVGGHATAAAAAHPRSRSRKDLWGIRPREKRDSLKSLSEIVQNQESNPSLPPPESRGLSVQCKKLSLIRTDL